ncbi:glutathione S-transferase [Brevundimonas sp. EAKA]|jgi:GSH-dependent disulfide-bond oxidoreductase|uniref:Glutathione S-transferase n=1 Tax=Brevundimonas mediterranea TaxID=74329 RepID=A0AB37E327_9CAUL|nr:MULTISPECIES: glutathione S-transferase N-terminal domain-containing protein [Brevundimonas]MDZ4321515.1 glutathione S-transferase N-terminal domain-containing protein [Phenylobacterium sp.]OGN43297.1 MAG: glutathione S-transferase [Caulobacterales bacterium GWE1_67_11]OYX78541.1 MAG: glutathione S-transferase [Brevundimonas sp. 32-68-21]EDX80525.1 Glutathione S-transferase, N-terminal domain protein [Brevundimonas sp. BAL3]KDP93719.1 glutathione S-transferase [Brevundimonas sp. EAKA]
MTAPIQLWYWPTPNGWKVSIALEEMGLAYEVQPVNIGTGEQFEPGFQAISPNGRMPAIVDPEGPGGQPISIFESGAILQYLGDKSGRFYPTEARARVEVNQWLFWQVGGLGPMAGQTHHFRQYAPAMIRDQRQIAYGVQRYTNETHRLYGVMDRRLKDRDYLAGDYSIADMAAWPWILPTLQGQTLADFPHLAAWMDRVGSRPAVKAGRALLEDRRGNAGAAGKDAEAARRVLFGQRAAKT